MMKRRKRGATVAVGIAFAMALGIGAGCSPQPQAEVSAEEDQASGYTAADTGGWEEAEDGAMVRTLEDGRQVQLCLRGRTAWNIPPTI